MFVRTTAASCVLLVSFVLGFAGCGDDTGGGSGGTTATGGTTGDDGTFPSDLTSAGITQFLSTESYKSTPWTGDTVTREVVDTTSPHTRVRVFYNPTLIDGDAAGAGELSGLAFPAGSATVKELYDATDTLVGRAAMFRTETDQNVRSGWVYYCWGPAGECAIGSPELAESSATAKTDDGDCSYCHGNTLFTKLDVD